MTETLVQIIRSIENLSPDRKVNKAELIKSVWEGWGAKNRIVSECSEGKTTFLIEYEKAYGGYDNYRAMLPYSVPKGHVENHTPLNECIGSPLLPEGISSYITNPLVMGGVGTLIWPFVNKVTGPLLMKYLANPQKMDRRTFLKKGGDGIIVIGGGVIAGLVGFTLASGVDKQLKQIKGNATYLDHIYDTYVR